MDAKELNPKLMLKLRELSAQPDGWGEIRVIDPEDARSILAAIASSDAAQAPATVVELAGVEDALKNDYGFWHSCSGCHETEDGHSVGKYEYSTVLKCDLGAGCSECGGIGAVWDNTDYDDMVDWIERRERDTEKTIDAIMEQAQVFASAWSLVGGVFDAGNGLETAEHEKATLRDMLKEAAPVARAAAALLTDEQLCAIQFAEESLRAIAKRRQQVADTIEPLNDIRAAARRAAHALKRFQPVVRALRAAPPLTVATEVDDEYPPTPESERAAFNGMMRWHLIRLLQAWRYNGDQRAAGIAAFEWARTNDVGQEAFKASERNVKLAARTPAVAADAEAAQPDGRAAEEDPKASGQAGEIG